MNPRNKPKFKRTQAGKTKKFGRKWVKPRGRHNKMRLGIKGKPKSPSPGYGSPRSLRGLSRRKLKPVRVFNVNDLSKINTKNEALVLFSGLGMKKKIEILERVKSSGVHVLNVKDVQGYLSSLKNKFEERKKLKKAKQKAEENKVKKKVEEKKSDETKKEVKLNTDETKNVKGASKVKKKTSKRSDK